MDNLTLYSHRDLDLSVDWLGQLAGNAQITQGEGVMSVSWQDVTVRIHPMTVGPEMADHLQGFQGYIRSCAGGNLESVAELLEMIGAVRRVYGCQIEPGFDDELKAKSLLVSLAATLERCFMFYDGQFFHRSVKSGSDQPRCCPWPTCRS